MICQRESGLRVAPADPEMAGEIVIVDEAGQVLRITRDDARWLMTSALPTMLAEPLQAVPETVKDQIERDFAPIEGQTTIDEVLSA